MFVLFLVFVLLKVINIFFISVFMCVDFFIIFVFRFCMVFFKVLILVYSFWKLLFGELVEVLVILWSVELLDLVVVRIIRNINRNVCERNMVFSIFEILIMFLFYIEYFKIIIFFYLCFDMINFLKFFFKLLLIILFELCFVDLNVIVYNK